MSINHPTIFNAVLRKKKGIFDAPLVGLTGGFHRGVPGPRETNGWLSWDLKRYGIELNQQQWWFNGILMVI